jgi:hypothetical protein
MFGVGRDHHLPRPMPSPATSSREQHRTRAVILVVAAFILLLLAALLFAPAVIPTEPLRRTAESRAEEALERPVEIGSLGVRILPRPTVELHDVRVGGAEGDRTDTLAEVDRLRVHVSPLPLLSRRVVIPRAIVDGGVLTVARLPDGTLSIADLMEIPEPDEVPDWDVEFTELAFEDVRLVFVDHHVTPGETVTTRAHQLRGWVRLDQLEARVPLEVQMALFDAERRNLRLSGHLPLPGEEDLEAESLPIELHIVASGVETEPFASYLGDLADRMPEALTLDLALEGDLGANVTIAGWVEPWPGISISLSGHAVPAAEPPRMSLDVAVDAVPLERLLTEIPILAESLPSPVDARGHLDLRGRVVGTLDDLRVNGWTEMDTLRVVAGRFAGGAQEEGAFLLESEGLRVALNGRVPTDRPPRMDLDVRARRLDLDFEAGEAPAEAPPELPDATVSARMQVTEGRLLRLPYENLDARLALEEGRMAFQPTVSAFDGELRARLDTDMTRTPSQHRLQLEITEMDADGLTTALADIEDAASGRLSVAMIVGWHGIDWEAFEETAIGEGSVHLEDGWITTLDVHPDVAQALIDVAVTIGVLPPEEIAEPTVGDIRADFVIADGRAQTEVLEIDGDFVRVLSRGSLGFDRTMSVTGSFAFSPAAADRFGPLGQILRGEDGWLAVPFSIGGTVDEPEVTVDVAALLARAATGILGDAEGRWEALRRLWRERMEDPAG